MDRLPTLTVLAWIACCLVTESNCLAKESDNLTSVHAHVGDTVRLVCNLSDNGLIVWTAPLQRVPHRKYAVFTDNSTDGKKSTLGFKVESLQQAGNYKCANNRTAMSFKLTIQPETGIRFDGLLLYGATAVCACALLLAALAYVIFRRTHSQRRRRLHVDKTSITYPIERSGFQSSGRSAQSHVQLAKAPSIPVRPLSTLQDPETPTRGNKFDPYSNNYSSHWVATGKHELPVSTGNHGNRPGPPTNAPPGDNMPWESHRIAPSYESLRCGKETKQALIQFASVDIDDGYHDISAPVSRHSRSVVSAAVEQEHSSKQKTSASRMSATSQKSKKSISSRNNSTTSGGKRKKSSVTSRGLFGRKQHSGTKQNIFRPRSRTDVTMHGDGWRQHERNGANPVEWGDRFAIGGAYNGQSSAGVSPGRSLSLSNKNAIQPRNRHLKRGRSQSGMLNGSSYGMSLHGQRTSHVQWSIAHRNGGNTRRNLPRPVAYSAPTIHSFIGGELPDLPVQAHFQEAAPVPELPGHRRHTVDRDQVQHHAASIAQSTARPPEASRRRSHTLGRDHVQHRVPHNAQNTDRIPEVSRQRSHTLGRDRAQHCAPRKIQNTAPIPKVPWHRSYTLSRDDIQHRAANDTWNTVPSPEPISTLTYPTTGNSPSWHATDGFDASPICSVQSLKSSRQYFTFDVDQFEHPATNYATLVSPSTDPRGSPLHHHSSNVERPHQHVTDCSQETSPGRNPHVRYCHSSDRTQIQHSWANTFQEVGTSPQPPNPLASPHSSDLNRVQRPDTDNGQKVGRNPKSQPSALYRHSLSLEKVQEAARGKPLPCNLPNDGRSQSASRHNSNLERVHIQQPDQKGSQSSKPQVGSGVYPGSLDRVGTCLRE